MREIAIDHCDVSVRELLKSVSRDEAVVLTEKDRPCYVLVSMDDIGWEVLALLQNHEVMSDLDSGRAHSRVQSTKPLAEESCYLAAAWDSCY